VNAVFWPGVALLTLTPPVAALAFWGMARAREARWLLWVVLLPTLYFTARAALLGSFVPLSRFAVIQVALVLPFFGWALARQRRWVVAAVAAVAVGWPLWLGSYTFRTEGKWEDTLRPVSPTCTHPRRVSETAALLRAQVGAGESIILDADPRYLELQVGFLAGISEGRTARARWKKFREWVAKLEPRYLLRVEGGALEKLPDAEVREGRFRLGERWFEELPGAAAPFRLYRRLEPSPLTGRTL
jgi:hypothetical protein